ncbi:PREDICTED: hairy/enhancer-of-split related with YRPW motif protein 1 isoform X1 [Trachymyrmex septentrionalis]|uniref:hairy/enhancer-of-split related with YRPW motif protein 1 isoform X1 n=1 Tax=Trachymyrmex septentrionalis TaxID=34720 RepID=UPI00084F279A|nr:PREDICTED: hairy/enhancer-of-split related with YRPW motif protein 1 isoform X1 [Trachymyrmex septentrionalis]
MMETQNYWEDTSAHSMQVKYESLDGRSCKDEIYRMGIGAGYCEGNLNFATASEDDEIYTKKKVSRQDPMSHRIIEKRRRDRMNNCLADLSRLIPAEYLKKGRGRVEKTEIIEMAIRHMKHLQGLRQDTKHSSVTPVHTHPEDSVDSVSHSTAASTAAEHYKLGFQECLSETMHFLIEVEGFFARDTLFVQLINHLQQHCDKIVATSDRLGFPHPELPVMNGAMNGAGYSHTSIPTICQPNGGHSDHGSSSGVSSFGDPERPLLRPTIVPPPTIVSDDSNHSTHSHSTPPGTGIVPCRDRPTNYKFKSSIKQRFSAERVKSCSSPVSNGAGLDKPPSSSSHGVPIFALHDAGSFYVPLTVEASLIRPHLSFIPDTGPDTVLHPVTISVNFNHSSPPAWSQHHSPIHQHQT